MPNISFRAISDCSIPYSSLRLTGRGYLLGRSFDGALLIQTFEKIRSVWRLFLRFLKVPDSILFVFAIELMSCLYGSENEEELRY